LLLPGTNTIRLSSRAGPAPNLDKITVGPIGQLRLLLIL
jgi:hypothetical protein